MTASDNITEAIDRCDEVKARLEALRDMTNHGSCPGLRIESITRPGDWWEPRNADDLADCPEGTVIEASSGWRYYRLGPSRDKDWMSGTGKEYTHGAMLKHLTLDAADYVTFCYSGNF